MNLYEKLNRLDDSLVESKRVIKKKKLTESVEDDKKKLFDAAASVKCKLDDHTIEYAMYDVDDFIENELVYCGKLLLSECPDMLFWRYVSDENFGSYCAVYESDEEFADAYYQISHDRVYDITDEVNGDYDDYDDDIDEMLTESTEQYELSTLVKDSINHLVNNLGKDPMADDFGDDVCADLEDNYDIDVPQNPVKYADWCDAVMTEVSRQLNKEELTESPNRVKIEVKYETYGRYGDGGQIKTGRVSGSTEVEALMKMLDHVHMYTDSDYAEEFKEENGRYPTTEEVTDKLYEQNGDGCDLIYWIRNLTTGEMIFDGAVEESEPEEWDDDIDEMLTENTRNNKLQSVANQIIKYAEENPGSLRNFKYMYDYIDNLSQEGRFEIPAKVGQFVLQDPENVTEVEAEEFINMLLDETDISDRLIQIKEANRKDAWDKLRKQFPSL